MTWPPEGIKPYFCDDSVCIVHGDCRDVLPKLATGSVDLVLTDPPYGIDLCWHDRPYDRRYRIQGDTDGALGAWVVIWAANKELPIAVFASPWHPWPGDWRSLLVWDKGGAVGGGGDVATCFKRSWELIQVARNVRLQEGRDESVLRYHSNPVLSQMHPAAKPLALITYLVRQLSLPGELILDPFAGSCTTGRAAKDLGRKAILIEIEEKFCEIGAKRMAQSVMDLNG